MAQLPVLDEPVPDRSANPSPAPSPPAPAWCPFSLRVSTIAAFLNAELVGHPVYDGIELQRFEDPVHGRGVLAFLSRRDDRTVDYYVDPSLRVDRASYRIGGGTGRWIASLALRTAELEVTSSGVRADVRFTDVDGRHIEVRVDDRLAGRRQPGVLLAPVGAAVEQPASLLLVHLHGFDLVRRVSPRPEVRIDGALVATGHLPGAPLHRRHLIKAAAPLTSVEVCPDGGLDAARTSLVPGPAAGSVAGVRAVQGLASGELRFEPSVPAVDDLPIGRLRTGTWHVAADGATLTGGTWDLLRRGDDRLEVGLHVTDAWRPSPHLPPLLRVVTRALPVFRTWPTTYRWRATFELGGDGPRHVSGGWTRTATDLAAGYRRATS